MSLALATGIALWGRSAASEPIRGVGAALPKTVYAEWARVYEAKTHVAVSYCAMAPTAALGELASGRADFGASEVPHVVEELAAKGFEPPSQRIQSTRPRSRIDRRDP
jgi:ABC-type phosphate transport system substrate-binding protein